ncbi:DoxX family membrane protein [Streptomyces pacificus]|uniref:DoxX family membrane protein n=1 Tax=Streptomyces pacificus TaxID=2705029 RepID=A0A6A0AWK4_9ACTN|nr:DoxX family membrane protein [Streptomyces pacificus]GFH36743.1 DoxX family membrane protein [Streptomyces pacificus]
MSVDTRTPRPGFDDQLPLNTPKVDCDPAQVIVNHASFRVKLGPSQTRRPVRGMADTTRFPALGGAGARTVARRRAPVVWSGKSAPGDPAASGLLQAVRSAGAVTRPPHGHDGRPAFDGPPGFDAARGLDGGRGLGAGGATQLIPRVAVDATPDTLPTPVIGAQRREPLLPPMRPAEGAYDAYEPYHREAEEETGSARYDGPRGQGAAIAAIAPPGGVRHAYYPGRRMNLGVVLLPLRVFLGFISIYAGMGKLCDPVYFDGGERGSMIKWLSSLEPWAVAEPLRDFALAYPVGAGLTVAFLQVVVGVLTVLGLWQRAAAVVGASLSAALIMTVSWRTAPVYDAPDIMNLAAWSPLVIAGAPVYSVDGRLAGEAWRTLGPRSELWELRRRVLRRGGMVAAVVVGMTLLVGSVLGGAVRSTELVTVPGPDVDPTNHLPGTALPSEAGRRSSPAPETEPAAEPARSESGTPAAERAEPSEAATGTGTGAVDETGRPSESRGTDGQQAPARSEPVNPPSSSSGPSSSGTGDPGATGSGAGDGTGGPVGGSGGGGGSAGAGGGNSAGSGSSGGSGGGTGGNRNPIGGLLG